MNTASPPAGGDDQNACNLRAVIVLISYGANGYGAPLPSGTAMVAPTSATEIANTNNDLAFVNSEPSANPATEFDDLVYAWSPGEFIDPLAQQGVMKSAVATTNEQLRALQSTVVNIIVNDMTVPHDIKNSLAAYSLTAQLDPWGGTIALSTSASGNVCSLAPGQTAFTLTSPGLDGAPGTYTVTNRNDDIVLPVSADVIRTIILSRGNPC
jgi:hypothetical protein